MKRLFLMKSRVPSLTMNDLLLLALTTVAWTVHLLDLWSWTQTLSPGWNWNGSTYLDLSTCSLTFSCSFSLRSRCCLSLSSEILGQWLAASDIYWKCLTLNHLLGDVTTGYRLALKTLLWFYQDMITTLFWITWFVLGQPRSRTGQQEAALYLVLSYVLLSRGVSK